MSSTFHRFQLEWLRNSGYNVQNAVSTGYRTIVKILSGDGGLKTGYFKIFSGHLEGGKMMQ